MKEIEALRARRAEIARNMRALNDAHKGAAWGPEQQTKWADFEAELTRADDEIARKQRLMDMEAANSFADRGRTPPDGQRGGDSGQVVILNRLLRVGENGLRGDEITQFRDTMSTTTGSEGGYTVPTTTVPALIEAMKEFGGMRAVATVITTSSGEAMNYPSTDGTAEVGELVAENAPVADLDIAFGNVPLVVYKFSSKTIGVPVELLQDSAVNLEALIYRRLGERIARIQNTYHTTGTGIGQPGGIVEKSSLGKTGANGQTTSIIYDDLLDLQHAVDPAYRKQGGKWMMADKTVKAIRKLKDAENRPIWLPSYDGGIAAKAPETLLGDPIVINQDIPVMAANAKSILYGLFLKYIIRDVPMVTIFRFADSAYAKKGQVGFLSFMRGGGNLTDTAAVKHYANSAA
jgi:HK97 family phage major capsid protein